MSNWHPERRPASPAAANIGKDDVRIDETQNIARLFEQIGAALWMFDMHAGDFELCRYPEDPRWTDFALFASDPDRWHREVLHPDDCDEIRSVFERMASGTLREPISGEYRVRAADNEIRWRKVRGFPIFDEHGNPRKYFGTIFDITDERAMRAEQRKLREILFESEKQQAIAALGAGLAHDWKNLLLIMSMEVERLRDYEHNVPQLSDSIDALDAVIDEAKIMSEQLTSLRHRDTGPLIPCDIVEEIGKSLGTLRRALPTSVRLIVDMPSSQALRVWARPSYVHLLVLNLSLNARDAMGISGGRLAISLAGPGPGQRDEGNTGIIALRVRDDGCGMSDETIDRAFEPLYAAKKGGGVGLGLAVVQSIVDELGGSVTLDSEEGRGTEVVVHLPIAKDD